MKAIFRMSGETLDYTPEADTEAGTLVTLGAIVGITKFPIKANTRGVMTTVGVFENVVKHNSSNALTAGQIVFVNPSNGKVYGTQATGYIPCGYALEAATATSTTCKIFLTPTVQPAKPA